MSTSSKRARQQLETLWNDRQGLCFYCNKFTYLAVRGGIPTIYKGTDTNPYSVKELASRDHKIPLSRNGSDTIDNMVLCCKACNELKACSTDEEFIQIKKDWGCDFEAVLRLDQKPRVDRNNQKDVQQKNKETKLERRKREKEEDNRRFNQRLQNLERERARAKSLRAIQSVFKPNPDQNKFYIKGK
jgi:hypothetical protein